MEVIFYFIIFNGFIFSLVKDELLRTKNIYYLNYVSQISIIIQGTGEQKILSSDFHQSPQRIYVNDIFQIYTGKKYLIS